MLLDSRMEERVNWLWNCEDTEHNEVTPPLYFPNKVKYNKISLCYHISLERRAKNVRKERVLSVGVYTHISDVVEFFVINYRPIITYVTLRMYRKFIDVKDINYFIPNLAVPQGLLLPSLRPLTF